MPLLGLTLPPEAVAVCPTAKIRKPSSRIFLAALISLSWTEVLGVVKELDRALGEAGL
ncbi:hypothetical protein VB714_12990 [Spirulina sp. 06S082]|nr:hypothetical protein [Spirulina sp. 06S082]MEA5469787.1 hypothetical protein [Spirulina sp. 06S082]